MKTLTIRNDGLITTPMAAELCGVTTVTIYHWIERGTLPVAGREGSRILLNLLDVARAELATRARAGRTPPMIPGSWETEDGTDLAAVFAACALTAAQAPLAPAAVVYYLSLGDRVKIGTTVNVHGRIRAIPHDRLLATEPGGLALERERHRQFASARVAGEWFSLSPALRAHLAGLRRRDPLNRVLAPLADL